MTVAIGNRFPALYLSDEGDEPFYFKEDVILPEIPPEAPEDTEGIITYEDHRDNLLHCARKALMIPAGARLSDRNIATVRLAEFFGIEDIIIPVKRCSFTYDGKEMQGIRMPAARGASIYEIDSLETIGGYRLYYTPAAVRQLTILVMFDFICSQTDRHSKNIRLITDRDVNDLGPVKKGSENIYITGICAIDHDLCFGEIGYDTIKNRIMAGRCVSPEFLDQMQYTAVDESFCDRVLSTGEDKYRELLEDLLSEGEIEAFFDRIDGLRDAVKKQRAREEKLISEGVDFFSRFLSTDDEYTAYLKHMEEDVLRTDKSSWDMRFSYRPSYLKKEILLHEALPFDKD